MRPIRSTRLAALAGLVLGAVLATSGSALAGTLAPPPAPSSSGKVGTFTLIESQEVPAVTCFYGDPDDPPVSNSLARMTSAAPRVKAAAGRTSQKVAWRLSVMSWDPVALRWKAYGRSGWTTGTAKPRVAAPLAKRTVRLRTYDDPDPGISAWRAKAEIRWYGTNGTTVTGRASIWATWYLVREGSFPPSTSFGPECGWTTG